jgi:tetratricopeptide (TPR) repeat protein
VADGSLLWGDHYERGLADMQGVQEEIVRGVVAKLRLNLTAEQQRLLGKRFTENDDAYVLYLKGRHLQEKQAAGTLAQSKECLDRAIALDANFPLAYCGLAAYYWIEAHYSSTPPKDLLRAGSAATEKALQLDNTLAEAHAMRGIFKAALDFDWQGADSECRQALTLDPKSAISRDRYGYCVLPALGRFDEAIAELEQAVKSDPLSAYYQYHLARVLILARLYDRALEVSRNALALDPNNVLAQFSLGLALEEKQMLREAVEAFEKSDQLGGHRPIIAYRIAVVHAKAGRRSEAQGALKQVEAVCRERYCSPVIAAEYYLWLGEKEKSLELIAKAVDDRDPLIFELLLAGPHFDGLQSDPRYQALRRKMNLGDKK